MLRKAEDEILIFLRECGARKELGGKREIHSSNKKVVFECLSTQRFRVITRRDEIKTCYVSHTLLDIQQHHK